MHYTFFTKKAKNFIRYYKIWVLLIFGLGLILGFLFQYSVFFKKRSWINYTTDQINVSLCFTPPAGCAELIVQEIKNAQQDIFIQAYVLTNNIMIDAILDSLKRGIKINILLDYKNYKSNIISYKLLKSKGANVSFDHLNGLAHNKVIIIDKEKVITGSFNFSNAADKRNAENVLFIQDAKIASEFLNNWINRKVTSVNQLAKKTKKYAK